MKHLFTGSRDATKQMEQLAYELICGLEDGAEVIVGDADGIDARIIDTVDWINEFTDRYIPITVHGAYGRMRRKTLTGMNISHVHDYLERDIRMAEICDDCTAIWDGESNGTRFTFNRARNLDKPVIVYSFKYGDFTYQLYEPTNENQMKLWQSE